MTSAFDPSVFLNAQISEPTEKRPPLPVENPAAPDGLYTAQIGEVKGKTGEKDGKPWMQVQVPLDIEVPPQLREAFGLPEKVRLTDGVFIDLTPDGRGIDNSKGRNRGMRNYREATDLNKAGDVFSWPMLQGRYVKVKVQHEMYQDTLQERIAGVFKVS